MTPTLVVTRVTFFSNRQKPTLKAIENALKNFLTVFTNEFGLHMQKKNDEAVAIIQFREKMDIEALIQALNGMKIDDLGVIFLQQVRGKRLLGTDQQDQFKQQMPEMSKQVNIKAWPNAPNAPIGKPSFPKTLTKTSSSSSDSMSNDRKTSTPSPVLHLTEITVSFLSARKIFALFSCFGSVERVLLMSNLRKAMVQFSFLQQSGVALAYFNSFQSKDFEQESGSAGLLPTRSSHTQPVSKLQEFPELAKQPLYPKSTTVSCSQAFSSSQPHSFSQNEHPFFSKSYPFQQKSYSISTLPPSDLFKSSPASSQVGFPFKLCYSCHDSIQIPQKLGKHNEVCLELANFSLRRGRPTAILGMRVPAELPLERLMEFVRTLGSIVKVEILHREPGIGRVDVIVEFENVVEAALGMAETAVRGWPVELCFL